jgi:basic amino acid/polyamine antiporter, APA family
VLERVLGPIGAAIMAMGLMISSFGTLHSSVLSGSRVPYAMSRDGLLPRGLSTVSERTRIPVISVIVQGVWASVLALSGSFDTLTDYVIFGSWIFYGLATASVFVLRKKYPQANRPYRTWGYPVVPFLFLIVTAFLLINTLVTQPVSSFVGLGLIALGLPVYGYYARRGGIPADPFAEESVTE